MNPPLLCIDRPHVMTYLHGAALAITFLIRDEVIEKLSELPSDVRFAKG